MTDQKINFGESMKKIEDINEWFENEDLDLEEALNKLREGKILIKSCKSRLEEIENEFNELQIDFSEDRENQSENHEDHAESASEDLDLPF